MKFKIGQEVAFDMNCPCGECEKEDQGYVIHIINGKETKDFLKRCFIFSEETMKKLKD
jgi:threonine dehydrogenase-like Zn-dependent dehydrogenase